MTYTKFIFAFLLFFLITGCSKEEEKQQNICDDHTQGYDAVCGCPGAQVAFAETCINELERDLIYYFGEVSWYCITDSMAVGVQVTDGTVDFVMNFAYPLPNIGWTTLQDYRNQPAIGSYAGCQSSPDVSNVESTYFIIENPSILDDLPDEIAVTLLHRAGPSPHLELLDSTSVILYKDEDRL